MVLKYAIGFLLSIRTTVWLLVLLLGLFLAGAFVMPTEEAFQLIHSVPLFDWLLEQPARVSWWLWGCVGIIGVLGLNTLSCSIESVIKKRKVDRWLMIIAPQVIHIGFLFMLLAHLLSSLGGFKSFGIAEEGGLLYLPNGVFRISKINISTDRNGYIVDWSVDGDYRSERVESKEVLLPNKPFFHDGTGIYVRDIQVFPRKEIVVEVSREPGGIWALTGGIIFMAGILAIVVLKMRRDYPVSPR